MRIVNRALSGAIRLYQLAVSPYLAMSCRYHPTCSSYAREAIMKHGAIAGGWMGLRRIARCHPWGGAGHDPVPKTCNTTKTGHEQQLSVEPGS